MLIESKIKPRHKPTRTVKVFGKDYVFAQRPGAGDAHVADVGDPQAVQALVATGAYAEFTAVVAPSTLTAPPTPSAAERKAAEEAERTRIAAEQAAQEKAAADAAEQAAREAAGSQETPVQTAEDTPSPPAADAGQQAPVDAAASPEIQDAAQTLLSGTPQSIRKAIGAGTPAEVIKAALAIEQAQQKPRPSVVATLKSAEG